MRLVLRALIGIALLPLGLQAQKPESWCAPDTSYAETHEENVASLRWSLYSLTELNRLDPKMDPLISRIADASVSSLANIYLLRAQYVRGCSVSRDVYYREMAANEKFISLLLATTSSAGFPAAESLAKNGWFIAGTVSESLKGKNIVLDESIRSAIRNRRNEKMSPSHPVWVACGLLLGESAKADEREVSPEAKLIPTNRRLDLAQASYSDSLSLLSKRDWQSNLHLLADYYEPAK